jgi:hypothetical protein
MSRRSLRFGTAAVVVYVGMALVTALWAPGRMRPLFDGFASHPGVYNWVKPPKEFAEGNRPPDAGQARINFGADGSTAATADTPDGQATASVPAGGLPPHPSDQAATIDLRPVDAGTLGALPAGLRPEGNAYSVTISYLPSGAQVPSITAPGRVGVMSDEASDTLLFSADGTTWRRIEGQPIANARGFLAPLTELGYYLAAGGGPPRAAASGGGPPILLFVLGAAVPLALGYLLLGRRRSSRSAATARPAAGGTSKPAGARSRPPAGANKPGGAKPGAKKPGDGRGPRAPTKGTSKKKGR